MEGFVKFIIFLVVAYFLVNWAADNPNGMKKLRSDINSAVSGVAEYAKSLSSDRDNG